MPGRLSTLYFLYLKPNWFSPWKTFISDSHCFLSVLYVGHSTYVLHTTSVKGALHAPTVWPRELFSSPKIGHSLFPVEFQMSLGRYSWLHWPLETRHHRCEDSGFACTLIWASVPKERRKLMVTITSTRQLVWWTISSLLKAQAIKSISDPFHIPDHNTNCGIKQCRLLQLKSQPVLPISSLFFHSLKQLLFFFHKRQDKSKHLYSMIPSSGDHCVHRVWPFVIPHHSPTSLPAPTKSSGWP